MTKTAAAPLLELDRVSKRFWATQALDDVSLRIAPGEFVGLVGENGAGKSTLLNILSGCERPDEGRLLLRGEEITLPSYHAATERGIFRIFQELALVPNLTVAENLFLSHEQRFSRLGLIDKRKLTRIARQLFEELDHGWVDVSWEVGNCDFATRQVIEIVKAFALSRLLGVEAPVILLDEPTAALAREEIEFLFELLGRVREQATIVFVSHRLTEVLELSDRLVVLKDGKVVAETRPDEVDEASLHLLMVGRVRDELFYKEGRQRSPEEDVVLEARDISVDDAVTNVSLTVRRGEIVGVAGVVGSGKSVLAQALFGSRPAEGEVRVRGQRPTKRGVEEMMALGVGYVTPDRQEEGILGALPVAWNVGLARLAQRPGRIVWIAPKAEARDAQRLVDRLRIKTPSVDELAENLSGGNQQKVILARWLALGVELLVLDNPTRGIDAGAKEEIYELLRDLADDGIGILLVSDDLLELIGLSNRVLVMKDGQVVREVPTPPGAKPQEGDLVAAMV